MENFSPREFITQYDRVVVLGYEKLRVKTTHNVFENEWVHVWTIRDGKIYKFQEFSDTAVMAKLFQ